jgi:hypothetical protein
MAPEPLVEFVLEKKLHAGVYQPGTAEHQKWQELQAHFMESGGRAWWHGPVLEDAELSLGVQSALSSLFGLAGPLRSM